jgi:ATP-dependent Clp protease adaptor protein ClpS
MGLGILIAPRESTMSITPVVENETSTDQKTDFLKQWHVVLLNTDDHTFEFVVTLIMTVFNKDADEAYAHTIQIHKEGRSILATTHRERAELYKEQVHAFGADEMMKKNPRPLPCELEPAG